MDVEHDWTASTLFSPSKARVQQAQARDWAVVDAWLSKKYPSKHLPAFERNEDTLQALLTLATCNENADERRAYCDRIDKTALSALSKRLASVDKCYQLFNTAPKDIAGLEILAKSTVALDCPVPDAMELAMSVVNLNTDEFALHQQLERVETQLSLLRAEQAQARQDLEQLQADRYRVPNGLPDMTLEWLRDAKHMRAKIAEYDERLNAVEMDRSAMHHMNAIIELENELDTLDTHLRKLELQLQSYSDLPVNPNAAQSKLENAKRDVLDLVRERDKLFEQLADGA